MFHFLSHTTFILNYYQRFTAVVNVCACLNMCLEKMCLFGQKWSIFCLLLVFVFFESSQQSSMPWNKGKHGHTPQKLTLDDIRSLTSLSTKGSFEAVLDPLLIPRVSGSTGNEAARQYIKNEMGKLGWSIDTDDFKADTPFGVKHFENVIATLNPQSSRRLVLACHYDSKYSPTNDLIGATDSAVPCAMMIHLAQTLQTPLQLQLQLALQKTEEEENNDLTLQLIFFDGEEAFQKWSSKDSLYGSRHLAQKMEKMLYPPDNKDGTTELDRMDMMILLDLIGAANPTFWNSHPSTSRWHDKLVEIESTLRKNVKAGLWLNGGVGNEEERKERGILDWLFPSSASKSYFRSQSSFGRIDDDHVPFMERGVDIVHLISSPFPRVWHTPKDNKKNLDFPTIENLNRVLRIFVTQYLHLPLTQL